MNTLQKIFVVSALTCSAAWLVKMPVIAATGGADADGPAVALLWALGTLGLLVAAGSGVALLAAGAPGWTRAVLGLAAVPLAFVGMNMLDAVVKEVYTAGGWFGDEVALVVLAVVLGALGLRTVFAGQAAPSAATPT